MQHPSASRLTQLSLAMLLVSLAGQPVSAQADASRSTGTTAATKTDPKAMLDDFEHYVLIDGADVAAATGQALLDLNLSPTEFVSVVEGSRRGVGQFNKAINRAMARRELETIAAQLLKAYESGKLATARSPEAVTNAIKDLTGTQRQRLFAAQRLIAAGEYAMPQLLSALLGGDIRLSTEVRRVMVEMGRQAVVPLTTALPDLDPVGQELVVSVLGDITYTHSLPYLYDLRASTTSPNVRSACEEAIRKIAVVVNDATPIADRYVEVANSYYKETPTLTPFQNDQNQLWWGYDPRIGLTFTAIDTSVYHEAMAMRLTERALTLDPANEKGVALWIAANFSREIDSPANYTNPAYPATRRDAMYYAVAAGSSTAQRVLARAIDDIDTPLARKAIAATEKTAGGNGLWEGLGSRKPLLEALRYSNRRVQYEAAMALGAAQPRQPFEGSDRVVPILASAIRDVGAKYAVVLASDAERQASLVGILQGKGYTVLPAAASFTDIEQALADAPGVDLIVTDLPSGSTADALDQARSRMKLRATPVLALVSAQGYADLAVKFSRDTSVRIARAGLSADEIGVSAEQLVDKATGGSISNEEAEAYRTQALHVLRDLGVSSNNVLNIADAAGPLISALGASTGPNRLLVGEVLAYVPTKSAQQALFDAAMAPEAAGQERVALLERVAMSAKRTGNQLNDRQVASLVELVKTGGDAEATAAASLMGALNLPNANIVPLILGKGG